MPRANRKPAMPRARREKRNLVFLTGGPWAGRKIYMPSDGTMRFTVYGYTGYYTPQGSWVNV